MNAAIGTYLDWLKANGVTADAFVDEGESINVVGYEAPTYIVWRNPTTGSVLRQGASLIAGRGDYRDALYEVQSFLGGPVGERIGFSDFSNPAQPAPPQEHPVLGKLFEGDGGVGSLFYVNASGVQEGGTYNLDQMRFVCIARGMFDRKWKRVA